MRIDRLLYFLRLCKSRSLAQRLVDEGHIRANGTRVTRSSHEVLMGDVLTIPLGNGVQVIELLAMPVRRGPAAEAQSHYRQLDPDGKSDLAATSAFEPEGKTSQ